MRIEIVAIVLSAGFVLAAVVGTFLWMHRAAGRARRGIVTALAGVEPQKLTQASSFGRASLGSGQVRGSGFLALAEHELVFAQIVPDTVLRIPLARIAAVTTPSTHLGKARGQPLLAVAFTEDDGSDDEIAWQVPDLDGWLGALRPRVAAAGG